MLLKVSLQSTLLRGETKWVVSWKSPNKRRVRRYFDKKSEAETEQADIRFQQKRAGESWLALTAEQRLGLITALADADKHGFTVQQAVDFYRENKGKLTSIRLGEAWGKFMAAKEKEKISTSAKAAYRSNVGRFIRGREMVALASIQREDIIKYLEPYTDETYNSYLTSIKTFFLWCIGAEFLTKSPAAPLKKIKRDRMANYEKPPKTLAFDQLKALLKSTVQNDPGLIRYVAQCNFAGLRPERESKAIGPGELSNQIHVKGRTAKDRQARYVDIWPVLAEWLALPDDEFQGPMPFVPIKNLRRRFEIVREKAGLIKIEYKPRAKKKGEGTTIHDVRGKIVDTHWEQDIMRHTFASICYVLYGAEKTKEMLGHGDYDMLFSHYRNSGMTKTEAEKFLSLTPALIKSEL